MCLGGSWTSPGGQEKNASRHFAETQSPEQQWQGKKLLFNRKIIEQNQVNIGHKGGWGTTEWKGFKERNPKLWK